MGTDQAQNRVGTTPQDAKYGAQAGGITRSQLMAWLNDPSPPAPAFIRTVLTTIADHIEDKEAHDLCFFVGQGSVNLVAGGLYADSGTKT